VALHHGLAYLCIKKKKWYRGGFPRSVSVQKENKKKKTWSNYNTPNTTLDQNGAGETVLKQETIVKATK